MSTIKVVYIAGATRSGSTLLSNILGETEGIFNAGELVEIWDRGRSWPCSCEAKVDACRIWRSVLSGALKGRNQDRVQEIIALRDRYAHTRTVLWQRLSPSGGQRLKGRLSPYIDALSDLYRSVSGVTGCSVIVDASKNPGYCNILAMVPDIERYIIHLIRDARATAYSWLQKKEGLWISDPGTTSLIWNMRNLSSEMMTRELPQRSIRILYEDFVAAPEVNIRSILKLIGMPCVSLPFISGNTVTFTEGHGICGNPDRFNRGKIALRLDRRWADMRPKHFYYVTLLTIPLLLRYRYRLTSRPKARNSALTRSADPPQYR